MMHGFLQRKHLLYAQIIYPLHCFYVAAPFNVPHHVSQGRCVCLVFQILTQDSIAEQMCALSGLDVGLKYCDLANTTLCKSIDLEC